MKYILKNNFLKRTIVVFLLATFGLSNTPTKVLHNIFADHSDVTNKENYNSKLKFTKTEFHCNCDNLVVLAPYIYSIYPFSPQLFKYFSSYEEKCNTTLSSFKKVFFGLRGPPSFA